MSIPCRAPDAGRRNGDGLLKPHAHKTNMGHPKRPRREAAGHAFGPMTPIEPHGGRGGSHVYRQRKQVVCCRRRIFGAFSHDG